MVFLAVSEYIINSFQSHSQDPWFLVSEHGPQSLEYALLHQVEELLGCSQSCAVADCPHCLLLDLHIVIDQQVQQLLNDAQLNAGLDLLLTTCCDVAQSPTHLLPDRLLLVVDDIVESMECTTVNGILSLVVISCDHIADGTETGHRDGDVHVRQELNDPGKHLGGENERDPVLTSITDVAHSPTHINQHILTVILYEHLGQ